MTPHPWLPLIAGVVMAVMESEQVFAAEPNGYAISNVNLRAGPETDYPAIVTVPDRAPIAILGCLADHTWCDVIFEDSRGWMRSIYLAGFYQGYSYPLRDYAPQLGYPVIEFDIGEYWDAYYQDRPFYGERTRWSHAGEEGWVDNAVFYDRLEPYGEWAWFQGQYVWVPINVDRQWRPYTLGRWVYTDRYGWMWVSNEPFGWATYHYGRWGFSNQVGWFWVPGRRWGPAWVSWRSSGDYLAWAPLPPAYDEHVSINIAVETVPDYYWQVVRADRFLSADLPRDIVRDAGRFEPILRETRPLGNVIINNDVVVNKVVNVTYVENKTKQKVIVHKLKKTKDVAKAGKFEGADVEVFQPSAKEVSTGKAPTKPKKIEEVAVESKTKEQGAGKRTTEDLLISPEIKKRGGEASLPPPLPPGTVEDSKGKPEGKRKKAKGGQHEGLPTLRTPPLPSEADDSQGKPEGKRKKAKGGEPDGLPATGTQPLPGEAEDSKGKPDGKRKKAKGGEPDGLPAMRTQPLSGEEEDSKGKPEEKRKKAKGGEPDGLPAMRTQPLPGEPAVSKAKPDGKRKKAKGGQQEERLPPPSEAEAPKGKPQAKQKKAKKEVCPEGMRRREDGTCAPRQ